ncbi:MULTISPECIES: FAD-binding oxidoreductase [unclassified Schlesneria]|uniref:FAD-binding oxidoreductase n=2 Tax=Planctomycetaceae TaxID=126 RepID=UPI00359F3044
MTTTSTPAEFVPATQAELARFMAENVAGPRKTICPVGGRTALHYGAAATADLNVSLAELTRVIDYPARDMTITVEAGMRIDELQSRLAAERQRLPIDIAQPTRATLGGAIATNTSGSRRFGHGTFRDYVIGISAVDAAGQLFKAGGRVVKNVAGYDICKLLVGSRGTLGIVTQVTLKLRPMPETTALACFGFKSFERVELALQRLLKSDARPVAVDVLNPPATRLISTAARTSAQHAPVTLCLGVEGSKKEVEWQLETLHRELAEGDVQSEERIHEPDAARLWEALTEFPTCADDPLTFQANLLPSKAMEFASRATQLGVAIQVHAGNGIVVGQLPDEAVSIEKTMTILNELRQLARSGRGNLVVLHCDPEWKNRMPMCGDPEPSWGLMQRLKQQLDPHGLLNPGRFVDAVSIPAR